MRKITVRELKNNWQLVMGGAARRHSRIIVLFNTVERKIKSLLASQERGKTAVKVVYADGGHNESLNSGNVDYLLYTLTCFLEDFLPEWTFNKKIEKYQKHSEDYE